MKIYEYEGKSLEDAKKKALKDLKLEEEELFIKEREEESGLFKTKKTKLTVVIKEEVLKEAKDLLVDIIKKMGIEAKVEAKIKDKYIKLSMSSDNNSVLIGRAGRTIDSLQTIIKYAITNKTRFGISITLDVEDYKEKQLQEIEALARRTAREVISTGIEVKMDNMNSFERRLVHEEVSKLEGVTTTSEGEEPNRYVVIKSTK